MLQVAERGLQFVHNFAQLLAEQQAAAVLPQLFREAWGFSACISLATTTSRLMGAAAVLNKQAPAQPDSPAEPPQAPRYCGTEYMPANMGHYLDNLMKLTISSGSLPLPYGSSAGCL